MPKLQKQNPEPQSSSKKNNNNDWFNWFRKSQQAQQDTERVVSVPFGKALALQCTCRAYKALTCSSAWSWRNFCMTGLKENSNCFSWSSSSLEGEDSCSSPSVTPSSAKIYCKKLINGKTIMTSISVSHISIYECNAHSTGCTWSEVCWWSPCRCGVWEKCCLWSTCRWSEGRGLPWSASAVPSPVSARGKGNLNLSHQEPPACGPYSGQFLRNNFC